jgi:hypothetical protein
MSRCSAEFAPFVQTAVAVVVLAVEAQLLLVELL